jgi:hypothetical protein
MAQSAKTLQDLFSETLKDIYYAEKKILTSLPKMAKTAQSADLRAAFEKHERETEGQVERLEEVFALIEEPAKGKVCDAIKGILDEGKEIMKEFKEVMKEFKGSAALDAGLLGLFWFLARFVANSLRKPSQRPVMGITFLLAVRFPVQLRKNRARTGPEYPAQTGKPPLSSLLPRLVLAIR